MKTVLLQPAVWICLVAFASGVAAGDEDDDPGGTLNPEEMTPSASLAKAIRGEVDMVTCSYGYLMHKTGAHADARTIFEACAAKGWTATMTWMAHMEDNALGGRFDPQSAAEWDRRAAEAGDPLGLFHYGLHLLRGYGVAQDIERGRAAIDKAADAGLEVAVILRDSGYDPDIVISDADRRKSIDKN